jgi:hypothetical protein
VPAKDPQKRRATVRAWYARTKGRTADLRRSQRKLRKREIATWYAELKQQLVCARCGENHPACLQFHHPDPNVKEVSVADGVRKGWSRARILREIAICEVLCANCHAKHHARVVA